MDSPVNVRATTLNRLEKLMISHSTGAVDVAYVRHPLLEEPLQLECQVWEHERRQLLIESTIRVTRLCATCNKNVNFATLWISSSHTCPLLASTGTKYCY